MSASDELREFAALAVRGLSNIPSEVVVDVLDEGEHSLCLHARCNPADKGLIIGKQGRNVNAIRTLLCSIAAKYKIKVNLILKE